MEPFDALEGMAAAVLANEPTPTPARIREVIAALRATPICSAVSKDDAELLARQFESRLGVVMQLGATVTDNTFKPWLEDARKDIDPYYWKRYRQLLLERKIPAKVLAATDQITDRILGLMHNPREPGPWDRRGMVVGHVQSGKTANYIGLICKAADAGYKLIVVIAGIHNNLRNQTQLRMDEGFVGRDSARLLSRKGDKFVGVGRYDQTRRPVTFTNSLKDFSKAMATGVGIPLQNLTEPAVFVIKKNASTLKNLLEWLNEHSAAATHRVSESMLLIDDEADNASINIRHGQGEVSRINGQIRDLLRMFEKSCYVGYTATPFANIFIDPDTDDEMRGADLFPRNFIISLDPPSNYFGPADVFGSGDGAYVRHITDNVPLLPLKHDKLFQVSGLPDSLLDAVRAFVIARSIRLARGHDRPHCSMLVNVSRFTDVQRQLRNEIHNAVAGIQAAARICSGLPAHEASRNQEVAQLYRVWDAEYSQAAPDWNTVLVRLHEAAAPIQVIEVNSRSSGTLNYSDYGDVGLNVIAVGGFSLSRGLTLEGLLVSYFLRNSIMYDTLMQMGRWFGYRPGYQDLCRIWMAEEAEGWYGHITESIELLREELRRMEAAAATPEQFGLKVRSHPDTLIVTARNKMGTGERVVVSIGLGNNFVETAVLKRDSTSVDHNLRAAQRLVTTILAGRDTAAAAESASAGWLLRQVPVDPILSFLADFRNHEGSYLTDGDPVRRYIEGRRNGELASWDVLIAGVQSPDVAIDIRLGVPVRPQRRTAGQRSDRLTLYITNKQRVASRGVERTGVPRDSAAAAEAAYRDWLRRDGRLPADEAVNYPDRIYRAVRTVPLLILHYLQILEPGSMNPGSEKVVAWSISFPRSTTEEERVEYVVNTTWLREAYGDELDEEEMGGDA